MKYSCDVVQAPLTGDPNYGDCLATAEGSSRAAAIKKAVAEAKAYARAGKIHILSYRNGPNQDAIGFTGEDLDAANKGILEAVNGR